jgi:hypothetical protein
LWYAEPDAIGYAMHRSRSHRAVIRVYGCGGQHDAADDELFLTGDGSDP